MNVFAERALSLIQKRYTVIPLDGKKPVVNGWQNLRNVTAEKVMDWERAGLWKNIGMVTGAASDNIVVIDFDGLAGYEMFIARFTDLAETLTVATGSGNGMHCYYRVELLPDSRGYMDIPADGGELVNIEIKSDGKQVVIPPSIHPDTGKPYTVAKSLPIKTVADLQLVILWAQSLKPAPAWIPPKRSGSGGDNLNPKLTAAVESYFMSLNPAQHREWLNCSCPNRAVHKNGDSTPSFGYNTEKHFGYCYTCEGGKEYLLKEILPLIGIDPAAYGGLYERSENAPRLDVRLAAPGLPPQVVASQNGHAPAPAVMPVVTRSSRLSNYLDRLIDMEYRPDNPPIPFPLRVLHEFGGMAKVVKPGKLIGIVGTSGGGKTSLLETMVDGWLCYNVPCLVWSPEWEADEFIERAVQRYGGPSMEDVYLHEIRKEEIAQGIFENGAGQALNREQIARAQGAVEILRGWDSEVGYLDMPYLTVGYLQASIEETLKSLSFRPRALIIDYVQLLHALEPDSNLTMYNMLMRIKAVCRAHGLVGVLATQVTKDGAKGAAQGGTLDGLSARYVNDDAFNLFVTVNPDRNEDGSFLPSSVLRITKTSIGRKGRVRVATDWSRLTFSDSKHANQNFGDES